MLSSILEQLMQSSWHLLPESPQWKHQSTVWNLLKVHNKDALDDVIDIVLVSLLLILNRFHTLLWFLFY